MEDLLPNGLKEAGYSINYKTSGAETELVMEASFDAFKGKLEKLA